MKEVLKNTMYGKKYFFQGDYIASKCDEAKWYHGVNCHTTDMIGKIHSLIPNNSVIVDVGAFVGTFSIPLLSEGHESFMFESNPEFCKLLSKNTEEYGKNATVINNAVGNKNTKVGVFVERGNFGGTQICLGEDIAMTTLDSYFEKFDRKINFIKIDVETYEYYVLSGAQEIIEKHKPIIFWENLAGRTFDRRLFDKLGHKQDCFEFLRSLGYDNHETISNNVLSSIS